MTFDEFIEVMAEAEDSGIVTRICATHDTFPMSGRMEQAVEDGRVCVFLDLPMTETMGAEWHAGYDPCLPVFALTTDTLKEHFE